MKTADCIKSSIIKRRGIKGHIAVDEIGLPLESDWTKKYYADVYEITTDKKVIIYEVKSSKQDYRSDKKWQNYLNYCDLFYFVAPLNVIEIIRAEVPSHVGLYSYDNSYLVCIRSARKHKENTFTEALKKKLQTQLAYRFTKMHRERLSMAKEVE
ncbi:MAG: hypothetical protein COB42_08220 [Sulfurimonas sp.]|nr:MAG: hypothetical protein COB42_08220 [Sulfurimonas sp.]